MATVIIINVYFRSATTHTMPDIVRDIFLKFLPRVLMMKRPERIPIYNGYFVEEYCVEDIFDASLVMPSIAATILPFSQMAFGDRRGAPKFPEKHHRNCSQVKKMPKSWSVIRKTQTQNHNTNPIASPIFTETKFSHPKQSSTDLFTGKYTFGPSTSQTENLSSLENAEHSHEQRISRELQSTIESIAYIAEHVKTEMSDKKIRDDWKYISMVIDRLLLLVFFGITLGGTVGIIFSAPHVFDFVDQEQIIRRLIAESKIQAGMVEA